MTTQDHFQIKGPNGTHDCLVLELLGPSVADLLDAQPSIERLPGTLAKSIAKQTLLGLCFLHEQKIAHAGTVQRLSFTLTMLTILRSAYP
jgi:serine/threonine-protein kinase SRPK3